MTFEIVFNNDVLERSVVYVIVTLPSVVFEDVFVTAVVVLVVVGVGDVIVVLVVVWSVRAVRNIVRAWGAVVVLRGGTNFRSGLTWV